MVIDGPLCDAIPDQHFASIPIVPNAYKNTAFFFSKMCCREGKPWFAYFFFKSLGISNKTPAEKLNDL